MDKLTKRLRTQLLENSAVQIKQSSSWYLPVLPVDVTYKRVRRAKMDILMKMVLLTLEEATIRRAANLSELLLVEELFIADLMGKMQQTGLIAIDKGVFRLTSKGQVQLSTGIMEEELEEEASVLFYSPAHDAYWPEMAVTLPGGEKGWSQYRYAKQQHRVDESKMLHVLSECKNSLDENGLQTVVANVLGYADQAIELIPCLEFQLYNKEQDMFYARVWNTLLEQWDNTLEQQIEEAERVSWRESWNAQVEDSE